MTETAGNMATIIPADQAGQRRRAHLARRFAAERRFRYFGLGAVLLAASFLVLLLSTVVGKGLPAFTYHYVSMPIDLTQVDPQEVAAGDFDGAFRDGVRDVLPFAASRRDSRLARAMFSSGAAIELRNAVLADPGLAGSKSEIGLPVSDFADLYLKGLTAVHVTERPATTLRIAADGETVEAIVGAPVFAGFLEFVKAELGTAARSIALQIEAEQRGLAQQEAIAAGPGDEASVQAALDARETIRSRIAALQAQHDSLLARRDAAAAAERLDASLPSLIVYAGGGAFKVTEIAPDAFKGDVLIAPQQAGELPAGEWSLKSIASPENDRKFTDKEVAYMDALSQQGRVETRVNWIFLTTGASREPELAGIWGAVLGSFYTMLVTLALSFPIGVAAALYLEEFAPKNRLTSLIEVNINNLAAVPSIVFGLLGLAVFLNWFNMPRSAPLVGGMVLALMTLPTIIIASRAALKAVPPSIREAALGIGASRIQTVFHHVLPLAMPGILTGTIIGMAQALGETAPLLMIGMVAFIVDLPAGITDPATVLPVQIFMWADFPEPGFQQKTAAAIMILLGFLVVMNALAVILRRRFERRW